MRYQRLKLFQHPDNSKNRVMAAALEYNPESDNAPKVLASGKGKIAEQILAEARKHNIPVYEDPALTVALASVDLGEEIPVELYHIVAEVLAYVYRVTNKSPK